MHSKRHYKIFICSVILTLSLFKITNFKCNLTFYESENISDSSLHHILVSENFRFPFSKNNSVTWVVKYEIINLRKSLEIY